MSEGGDARNHEAEVEQFRDALRSIANSRARHADTLREIARNTLDAVRRSPQGEYPREEGDVIVIGPGCFAAHDRSVLNWDGVNYVPQPSPQGEDHEPDERALDTPLGARQRAQTQRDVADILEFGEPQDAR